MNFRRSGNNLKLLLGSSIIKIWSGEAVSRSLTAVTAVYIARVIDIETYGIVGYAAAISAFAAVFTRFGTDHILVRELSRDPELHPGERPALIAVTIAVRTALSLMSIGILFIAAFLTHDPLLSRLYAANAFTILGLLLPFEQILQANHRFGILAASRVLFNVINFILVLLLLHGPLSAWWIPLASGVSNLIVQLLLSRRLNFEITFPDRQRFRRIAAFLVKQSLPLLGSIFLLLIIGQLGIILVKHFSSRAALGLYFTGYKIYDIGNAVLVPVSLTLFPKLARSFSGGDYPARTEMLLGGMRITLPITLMMFGSALFLGREALTLTFGQKFADAEEYLLVLLATLCFRSISMFLASSLVAGGKQNQHLIITSGIVLFNLVMSFVFIPLYGASGAAWTVFCTYLIELAAYSSFSRNLLNLPVLTRGIFNILRIWAASAVSASLMYFVLRETAAAPYGAGFIFAASFGGMLFRFGGLTIPVLFPVHDHGNDAS